MAKGKALKKGATGFEFGADVLKLSVDALTGIYQTTVNVMVEGIKAGKTNTPLGLIHTLGYYDLLHGGAYAAPINARPFYLKSPAKSRYYGGDLQNLVDTTWVSWLSQSWRCSGHCFACLPQGPCLCQNVWIKLRFCTSAPQAGYSSFVR